MTRCEIQFCPALCFVVGEPLQGAIFEGRPERTREGLIDGSGTGCSGQREEPEQQPWLFENDIEAKRVRADDGHFNRGLVKQVRTSEVESKQ